MTATLRPRGEKLEAVRLGERAKKRPAKGFLLFYMDDVSLYNGT